MESWQWFSDGMKVAALTVWTASALASVAVVAELARSDVSAAVAP